MYVISRQGIAMCISIVFGGRQFWTNAKVNFNVKSSDALLVSV